MSKQANPAVIGGFLVGAIGLLVAAVLIFGSGRILSDKRPFVMHFDGSVKGLRVGAPVSFRGVKVGEVTDIRVVMDTKDMSIRTPVYAEFEPDRVVTLGGPPPASLVARIMGQLGLAEVPEPIQDVGERLIQLGMRAQLQMQSLVTGQLFVQLDFHPDTEIRRLGLDPDITEMPTIRSGMEKFAKRLEEMRIDDLVEAGIRLAQNLDALATSPEVKDTLNALKATSLNTQKMVKNFDAQITALAGSLQETSSAAQAALKQAETTLALEEGMPGRLASRLDETLVNAQGAFKQAETTLAMEEGAPGELATSLRATSDTARAALVQARVTLRTANDALDEESDLRYQIDRSLEELASAARSIRLLADYLERHPEAILVGKGRGRG